jgi:hypothetical protein
MGSKRVNVKAILADADLRRKLMVSTIQATQAREGIDTTPEQADRAYYVVSEGERASFFELERFKGGKRGERDRRHEMFIRSLRGEALGVRHDVARRDFAAIDGHPLAYERLALISHIFREAPALEPAVAVATSGLMTTKSERIMRSHWEIPKEQQSFLKGWSAFAKGGDFSRFYRDVDLLVDLGPKTMPLLEANGCLRNRALYGSEGLTWVPRTQRGFNVQHLPSGAVFGKKGPIILPKKGADSWWLLAVLNSHVAEFLLQALMSFGSYEVGVVQKLPIPNPRKDAAERLASRARAIHDAKHDWDAGNETSTTFTQPWVLRTASSADSVAAALDGALSSEAHNEADIRDHYAELNKETYRLYGIPAATCALIEKTLGDRPPENLWPQMEGKSADQKRMEHVWRLLSYAVKRVLEADDDGIVPFNAVNGEPRLVERVRHELATLFPGRDANQVEVEIVNELKRTVKGYRKCQSLDEWVDNVYFEYHCALYKKRPIFWHIASAQGTSPFAFGALVHYHRFDKNRMAKIRASYLRDAIEEFRREAGLADKAGRTDDRLEWQAKVEEAQALDKKLQLIQEGRHEGGEGGDRDYRILTPWKEPDKRPKGWDPDLDDGVKVNIEPFEKAGVLRVGKVT